MFKPILNNNKNDKIFIFLPFLIIFIFYIALIFIFPELKNNNNTFSITFLFLALIVFDVPHVWSTLYKTYLDKEIVENNKQMLFLVPFLSFIIISIIVFSDLSLFLLFWLLAFFAVYHFIKQQLGVVMLYSSKEVKVREKEENIFYKKLDYYLIWLITGMPIIYWFSNLDTRKYSWFTDYEFVKLPNELFPTLWFLFIIYILYYIFIQIKRIKFNHDINYYKYLYLIGTFIVWFTGIVWTNNMLIFGFGNMFLHGWNFIGIVYISTLNKIEDEKNKNYKIMEKIIKKGYLFFIIPLIIIGIIEQFGWSLMTFSDKDIYSMVVGIDIYNKMESI
ncbi:MAG: hypothetical protein Q9M94_00280, partial [Candidatus Gracilibacteria bacterium]|nr:hypothetical protein [Candidatus Gracilibacteria bacterium]